MKADCEVEKKLSTIACKMCISSDATNLTAALERRELSEAQVKRAMRRVRRGRR